MSPEQLASTMMLMNQQLQTLATQLEDSKGEVARLREQSEAAHAQWRAGEHHGSGGGDRRGRPMRLFDQKSSYPEVFKNERPKFRSWARRVMVYCNGMHPGFRKVMKWCQEQE